jgi:hypothetical protein
VIAGLDSSSQPSAAQAQAAHAAGVRLWSGYLQTKPNVGLFAPWTRQGFENARLCGSTPLAFCSGWDDPVALKTLAASWNLRLCLDVEGGIRPNGSWVQPFLTASGAGLYANAPYHGWTAPFHILAGYPGFDPKATWSGLRPAGACGWQWEGTHTEFGVGVDRGWYDDWFLSTFGPQPGTLGDDMTPEESAKLDTIYSVLTTNSALASTINDTHTLVKAILAAPPAAAGSALTPAQVTLLQSIADGLGRIEAALKAA